jgi:hypothetical protein
MLTGLSASLRRLFAKIRVTECYGDVSPTTPDKASLFGHSKPGADTRQAMRVTAKVPSDTAFSVLPAIICLDTDRFEDRLLPLSGTPLPFSSQWFD